MQSLDWVCFGAEDILPTVQRGRIPALPLIVVGENKSVIRLMPDGKQRPHSLANVAKGKKSCRV